MRGEEQLGARSADSLRSTRGDAGPEIGDHHGATRSSIAPPEFAAVDAVVRAEEKKISHKLQLRG
jgi:hypothetical protein